MPSGANLKQRRRERLLRRARAARPAPPASNPQLARGYWPALLELVRAASGDWNASIGRILQVDLEALHVAGVSCWTMSAATASLQCEAAAVAWGPNVFEHGALLTRAEHSEYIEALLEGRTLSVEDVYADPRVRELRDYCAARGVSSMLTVPMVLEGRVAGVLWHEHIGPKRCWSDADVDFAASAAGIVALALTRRGPSAAESALHRAAFLDNMSRSVLHALDAHEVARQAVELVVPELGDGALLFAMNQDGELECLATTHVDPRRRDLVERLGPTELLQVDPPGMARLVLRERQSVADSTMAVPELERYGLSPALLDILRALELSSVMGVPLAIGDSVFGSLMVFATNRTYTSDDLALGEQVANRIAMALENAHLYEMAREAIQARDEFLVLAAHELRTPLTALQLRIESMRRAGGDRRDACEMAAREVRRIGVLVEQMLDAAGIRARGVALESNPCDLAKIVDQCVQHVAERARRGGYSITVRSEPSLVGRWDCARLEQVVDRLLDNAMKFGQARPIEVALERNGNEAVLVVRDHGLGIAAGRLPSIFAPFERAVPKESFGGLGLGLYVTKAIVEAHGGSIAVTSRLGEGSTFVVRLPLEWPTSLGRHPEPASDDHRKAGRRS